MKKSKILRLSVLAFSLLLVVAVAVESSPFWLGIDVSEKIQNVISPPKYAQQDDWKLMIVNDEYHIPKNYNPELMQVDGGERVDVRIYDALNEMFKAAQDDEVYMMVASGYRTEKKQQSIINDRLIFYLRQGYGYYKSKKLVSEWVADVGTSEHQLGIAVDINQDPALSSGDEVYNWLYNNAHKYGFIKRYPHDKVDITGISNEPWHYRYVGIEAAEYMKQNNLCLEEYVEQLG